MSDAELLALAAIVNRETVLMSGENQRRERQGFSPAYSEGTTTPACERLEAEMTWRAEEAG